MARPERAVPKLRRAPGQTECLVHPGLVLGRRQLAERRDVCAGAGVTQKVRAEPVRACDVERDRHAFDRDAQRGAVVALYDRHDLRQTLEAPLPRPGWSRRRPRRDRTRAPTNGEHHRPPRRRVLSLSPRRGRAPCGAAGRASMCSDRHPVAPGSSARSPGRYPGRTGGPRRVRCGESRPASRHRAWWRSRSSGVARSRAARRGRRAPGAPRSATPPALRSHRLPRARAGAPRYPARSRAAPARAPPGRAP